MDEIREIEQRGEANSSTKPGEPEKLTPAAGSPRTDAVKGIIKGILGSLPLIFLLGELGHIGECASNKNHDNPTAKISALSVSERPNSLMISFDPISGVAPAMNDLMKLDHVPTTAYEAGGTLNPADTWRIAARIKGFTNLFVITREPGSTSAIIPIKTVGVDYGTCNYTTSFGNQTRSCINDQIGWVIDVLSDAFDKIKDGFCDTISLPIICKPVNWVIIMVIIIIIIVIIVIFKEIF